MELERYAELKQYGLMDEKPDDCVFFKIYNHINWIAVIEHEPKTRNILIIKKFMLQLKSRWKKYNFSTDHLTSQKEDSEYHAITIKSPRLLYVISCSGTLQDGQNYRIRILKIDEPFYSIKQKCQIFASPNIYKSTGLVCTGAIPSLKDDCLIPSPNIKYVCEKLINFYWSRPFNGDLSDTMLESLITCPWDMLIPINQHILKMNGIYNQYKNSPKNKSVQYILENEFNLLTVHQHSNLVNLNAQYLFHSESYGFCPDKYIVKRQGESNLYLFADYFHIYNAETDTQIQLESEREATKTFLSLSKKHVIYINDKKVVAFKGEIEIGQQKITLGKTICSYGDKYCLPVFYMEDDTIFCAIGIIDEENYEVKNLNREEIQPLSEKLSLDNFIYTKIPQLRYDKFCKNEKRQYVVWIANLFRDRLGWHKSCLKCLSKDDYTINAQFSPRTCGFYISININELQVDKKINYTDNITWMLPLDMLGVLKVGQDIPEFLYYQHELIHLKELGVENINYCKTPAIDEMISSNTESNKIPVFHKINLQLLNNSFSESGFADKYDLMEENRAKKEQILQKMINEQRVYFCVLCGFDTIWAEYITQEDKIYQKLPYKIIDIKVGDKCFLTEPGWFGYNKRRNHKRGVYTVQEILCIGDDDQKIAVRVRCDDHEILLDERPIALGALTVIEPKENWPIVGHRWKTKQPISGFSNTQTLYINGVVKRYYGNHVIYHAVFDNGVTFPCHLVEEYFEKVSKNSRKEDRLKFVQNRSIAISNVGDTGIIQIKYTALRKYSSYLANRNYFMAERDLTINNEGQTLLQDGAFGYPEMAFSGLVYFNDFLNVEREES